jgi:hypothetical protein
MRNGIEGICNVHLKDHWIGMDNLSNLDTMNHNLTHDPSIYTELMWKQVQIKHITKLRT